MGRVIRGRTGSGRLNEPWYYNHTLLVLLRSISEIVYQVMSDQALDFLRIFLIIVFLLAWLFAIASQLLMVAHRKPGIKLFEARFLYNPLMMQFWGHYCLTEKGIFWRNFSWFCFGIILICLVVMRRV